MSQPDYFKLACDITRSYKEALMLTGSLFTIEPRPMPRGYVDRRRAMVCLEDDCHALFPPGPTCPACASEQMMPVAVWLDRMAADLDARLRPHTRITEMP